MPPPAIAESWWKRCGADGRAPGRKLLLVVDQLEEVFTQLEEEERQA